jgi:hypothetical protein
MTHQWKATLNVLRYPRSLPHNLAPLGHRNKKNDALQLLKGLDKGGRRKRVVTCERSLKVDSQLTRIIFIADFRQNGHSHAAFKSAPYVS